MPVTGKRQCLPRESRDPAHRHEEDFRVVERVLGLASDGFDGSPGAAHGCNARYTIGQCVAPDRLFIAERVGFACRRIDGQIERARLETRTPDALRHLMGCVQHPFNGLFGSSR